MIDSKLRERVDERRLLLKTALAAAEQNGLPEDQRAALDSDLQKVEGPLRNGWEQASPVELGQLHKWLGDTTNDVPE